MLNKQSHKTTVLWAFALAEQAVEILQSKYPIKTLPQEALQYSKMWASGEITMRIAQRKILDCHSYAKELSNKADIALCHAIGQACAVVHTAKHTLGFPIYELTALVHQYGIDNCADKIENRVAEYLNLLCYYSRNINEFDKDWAYFLK